MARPSLCTRGLMKRYITIGFLVGAAILAQVSTASAQRWGRDAMPRSGACFYEHINFGGRYFCSPAGATMPEVPSGMNDKISSVRVFGDAAVTLYRDPDFRGQYKVATSDVADLRGLGFNDRLSSYEVTSVRGFDRGGYSNGNRNGNGNGYGYGNARSGVQPYGNSRWSYSQAESVVRRSYQRVLGRDADPEGLRSWTAQVMNANWTERDLENALRQSDEYRSKQSNEYGASRGRARPR